MALAVVMVVARGRVMFSRTAHQHGNILAALAHDHPLEGIVDHQILNLKEGQAERGRVDELMSLMSE